MLFLKGARGTSIHEHLVTSEGEEAGIVLHGEGWKVDRGGYNGGKIFKKEGSSKI